MAKLSKETVTAALQDLPGWRLVEDKIVRDYKFPGFAAAMAFVNQIAELAEGADHHPDIDIRYDKVQLSLISHDAGGITNRDIKFATSVNEKFPQ